MNNLLSASALHALFHDGAAGPAATRRPAEVDADAALDVIYESTAQLESGLRELLGERQGAPLETVPDDALDRQVQAAASALTDCVQDGGRTLRLDLLAGSDHEWLAAHLRHTEMRALGAYAMAWHGSELRNIRMPPIESPEAWPRVAKAIAHLPGPLSLEIPSPPADESGATPYVVDLRDLAQSNVSSAQFSWNGLHRAIECLIPRHLQLYIQSGGDDSNAYVRVRRSPADADGDDTGEAVEAMPQPTGTAASHEWDASAWGAYLLRSPVQMTGSPLCEPESSKVLGEMKRCLHMREDPASPLGGTRVSFSTYRLPAATLEKLKRLPAKKWAELEAHAIERFGCGITLVRGSAGFDLSARAVLDGLKELSGLTHLSFTPAQRQDPPSAEFRRYKVTELPPGLTVDIHCHRDYGAGTSSENFEVVGRAGMSFLENGEACDPKGMFEVDPDGWYVSVQYKSEPPAIESPCVMYRGTGASGPSGHWDSRRLAESVAAAAALAREPALTDFQSGSQPPRPGFGERRTPGYEGYSNQKAYTFIKANRAGRSDLEGFPALHRQMEAIAQEVQLGRASPGNLLIGSSMVRLHNPGQVHWYIDFLANAAGLSSAQRGDLLEALFVSKLGRRLLHTDDERNPKLVAALIGPILSAPPTVLDAKTKMRVLLGGKHPGRTPSPLQLVLQSYFSLNRLKKSACLSILAAPGLSNSQKARLLLPPLFGEWEHITAANIAKVVATMHAIAMTAVLETPESSVNKLAQLNALGGRLKDVLERTRASSIHAELVTLLRDQPEVAQKLLGLDSAGRLNQEATYFPGGGRPTATAPNERKSG